MARIAGINIPQNKLVQIGLTYIYGIGDKFSKEICSSLEIPKIYVRPILTNLFCGMFTPAIRAIILR